VQDVLETWMLLEYCDRGSLQRAIERGKLQSRAPGGGPDLVSNFVASVPNRAIQCHWTAWHAAAQRLGVRHWDSAAAPSM
jgi:hypothetical protein